MTEFFYVYLYTALYNISIFFTIVLVAVALVAITIGIIYLATKNDYGTEGFTDSVDKFMKDRGKTMLTLFLAVVLFVAFIPDQKDVKLIIGGGLAWKATQIEGVAELPENMVRVMNHFLETVDPKSK